MTNQEAFNTVYRHLLTQNGKAFNLGDGDASTNWGRTPNGTFRLRATDGKRCAVGILVPDHEYREDLENHHAYALAGACPSLKDINAHLLAALQAVHDEVPVREWQAALEDVARNFFLDVPTTFKVRVPETGVSYLLGVR